jgi:glutamine amidotransferase
MFPPDVEPNPEHLRAGSETNDDGHGFGLVFTDPMTGERRIMWGHGLNADATIDRFMRLRRMFPDGPALFHSRYGTDGHRSAKHNCHPFMLGEDERTIVAHNGILPNRVRPVRGDQRSDTAILAEEFLPHHPQFSDFDRASSRKQLETWLGPGNKLGILTVNPLYLEEWYILNEDRGEWHYSGVWYSNGGYQPWRKRAATYVVGGTTTTPAKTTPAKTTPAKTTPAKTTPPVKGAKTTAPPAKTTPPQAVVRSPVAPSTAAESAAVFQAAEMADDTGTQGDHCRCCQGLFCVDSQTRICTYCQACADCEADVESCRCADSDAPDAPEWSAAEWEAKWAEFVKDNDDSATPATDQTGAETVAAVLEVAAERGRTRRGAAAARAVLARITQPEPAPVTQPAAIPAGSITTTPGTESTNAHHSNGTPAPGADATG